MFRPMIALALLSTSVLPAAAQELQRGEASYMRYCATCHGAEADGRGPMSAILMVPPTDLTRLSATNDGIFPTARVVARIDGREPLVAHGSPMPLFGDFFEGRGVALRLPSGAQIMTSQPIVDLVRYLETRQKP